MDRKFIKSFYRNYYESPENEAIKDSKEYSEKRNQRYELEAEFVKMLQEYSDELVQVFEQYMDAYTDEQEVVLEEMYLLGAQDREKMLTIDRNTYIL